MISVLAVAMCAIALEPPVVDPVHHLVANGRASASGSLITGPFPNTAPSTALDVALGLSFDAFTLSLRQSGALIGSYGNAPLDVDNSDTMLRGGWEPTLLDGDHVVDAVLGVALFAPISPFARFVESYGSTGGAVALRYRSHTSDAWHVRLRGGVDGHWVPVWNRLAAVGPGNVVLGRVVGDGENADCRYDVVTDLFRHACLATVNSLNASGGAELEIVDLHVRVLAAGAVGTIFLEPLASPPGLSSPSTAEQNSVNTHMTLLAVSWTPIDEVAVIAGVMNPGSPFDTAHDETRFFLELTGQLERPLD